MTPHAKMSFGLAFISCPSCGESIMPSGAQFDDEPACWTIVCQHCGKTIEVQRDPVTGKMIPKVAKKN